MRFLDRADAGRRLAAALEPYAAERPIVLALPRGGVTVAAEVARALDAPLEAFIVRKLGAPFQPELGIGAIAEGDITYVDWASCMALDITTADVDQVIETERREVLRRVDRYRQGRPLPELTDRTVILVDDGVATGGTARAAIRAVRARGPRRLIFAVPVAAADTAEALRAEVDVLVAVHAPEQMAAIGLWYDDFHQVDDATVHEQLALVRRRHGEAAATSLLISVGAVRLGAELRIPPRATGLVLFAHGSGSSRFSPRNRFVADALARAGMATLLFDLLTEREEALDVETMSLRFDISLLAERLVGAIDWVASRPETRELGLGFFGSSTGAAAALIAAALRPSLCAAVVSRGGRPDLAQGALHGVAAPTLFIVGSEDFDILEINERALAELRCDKELVIIEGATHLFPEPGALQQVARVAADWFRRHLGARRVAAEARPGI